MSGLTNDPHDPRLTLGADTERVDQADVYLVLSDDERAKGYVRPVRNAYVHSTCGVVTTMSLAIARNDPEQRAFDYDTAADGKSAAAGRD